MSLPSIHTVNALPSINKAYTKPDYSITTE